MFHSMLPTYAVDKCEVSASLTDHGNISLILEAVNPGDHQLCQDAVTSISTSINTDPLEHNTPRKFEMAAFINLDSWVRNTAIDVQDRIRSGANDLKNQANVKFGQTLQDLDKNIQRLPSKGQEKTHSAMVFIICLLVTTLYMHSVTP